MPSPRKNEKRKDFIKRCMSSEKSKKSFPDIDQRYAFCNGKTTGHAEHILNKVEDSYAGHDAGPMNEYVFESKEEAIKMAKKIGLKGVHPHKTGDGKTLWMPGRNMKEFNDWYRKHSDKTEAYKYKCPYDDLDTIWTGEVEIKLAKTFYVMRCPWGHETLSKSPE